jgi:hypothetical protein
VRIPDVIPSCVVFLCVESRDSGLKFRGTAFHVAVRSESAPSERGWGYLVTARHNVERALENYGELLARVNLKGGGSEILELPKSWILPDNDASDVAIIRIPLGGSQYCIQSRIRCS